MMCEWRCNPARNMSPRRGLCRFLLDMFGDVGSRSKAAQHDPRQDRALEHLRGASDQIERLDGLDDIGTRRLNWHQHQIGAANGEDRRLRGSPGGIDHHNIVPEVELRA
jgi:hypothetical protein